MLSIHPQLSEEGLSTVEPSFGMEIQYDPPKDLRVKYAPTTKPGGT